jgi:crotonobetainyl-CoA:carnitine CoA-transferase CaiB-like acyl-CoA transferase
MGTRTLAALGAEVIKVEGPKRPDMLRGVRAVGVLSRYPEFTPGADSANRNAWFNTQNTDKYGVTVDIKDPRGLALVHKIAATSHVFIANYRPGVLARIGMGEDDLRAVRPDIIYAEMPGYGADGPMAGMQAYGAQFEANSGAAAVTGGDGPPLLTGYALGDAVAGISAAAAVSAAVASWRRTGEGCHLEIAQRDAMLSMFGEYFLAESLGRPEPQRRNGSPDHAPHGVYRAGDHWVAIAVDDDAQWTALADVLNVAADPAVAEFGTHKARRAGLDRVEEVTAAWVAPYTDASGLVARLQAAGVPAALVADGADLVADRHLRAAGFFAELDHPSTGRHEYPGLPFRMNGERLGGRTPAPRFGEHDDDVLTRVCGLDAAAIAELRADGVIAPRPDDPRQEG